MKDIQKTSPKINIPIMRVGIQNLKLPICVLEKSAKIQHTIADIDVYVDLDKDAKGIHMSRLIECAHQTIGSHLDKDSIKEFAKDVLIKSEAKRAELIFKFPYFIVKTAPVSKKEGYVNVNVEMKFINHLDIKNESFLSVEVLSTSLCPCSREISDYGAHNQRSKIVVSGKHIDLDYNIWIEDIVKIVEKNSSCELFSILKRPDEKYVTEKAYNNPNFVEDSSRKIYKAILNEDKFSKFRVTVINEESIHQHNAIAILEYPIN